MKHFTPFLLAAAFLTLGLLAGNATPPPPPNSSIEVIFAPTGKDRKIQKTIEDELEKAKSTVDLAIYQFTAPSLSKQLAAIRKRVKVRILCDGEQAKYGRKDSPVKTLAEYSDIEIKYVNLPGSGSDAPKFHHKFCVIDGAVVLTGSYNWTVLADEENHENLLTIRDAPLAKAYHDQFEKVWNNPTLAQPPDKAGKGMDVK